MTDWAGIGRWDELMYALPGGAALLVLLLSALGGGMRHGHHGGGMRHGGGVKHGGGQKHAGSAARAPGIAAFFGLGRVPGPLVWGSALLGWGVFGFWGTPLWRELLPAPGAAFAAALATAVLGAFLSEKLTVEAVSRFLPGDESFAVSAVDLCGLTGTVVFPINDARGRVHVYDAHGSLHDVSARTGPGQAAIGRGRSVLIADYDASRDQLIVESIV